MSIFKFGRKPVPTVAQLVSELKIAASRHPANIAPSGVPTPAGSAQLPHGPSATATSRVAYAAGFAAGNARIQAVFASEHVAGREIAAGKLLSNPKLSAAEIIGMLAEMPDQSGAEALALMRGHVPPLGLGGSDGPRGAAAAPAAWARAIQALSPASR